MTRPKLVRAFAALVAVALPLVAEARLIDRWPYDRLLRESDLVVLARAVASADAGETWTGNPWKAEFIGVNTTFEVLAVLKGTSKAGPLTVLHYRLDEDIPHDSPWLVSFRLKPVLVKAAGGKVLTQ